MVRNASGRVLEKRADLNEKLLQKGSEYKPGLGKAGNWARRRAYGAAAGGVGGYNVEAQMSARRAEKAKMVNDQIATGRDEEIRALTVDKASALKTAEGNQWRYDDIKDAAGNKIGQKRQFKTLGGSWQDESYVDKAQKRWGGRLSGDTFAQQAALSYEMRKASSEEEIENLTKNYGRVAKGSWGMSDNEAAGSWIGAAFENQQQHLELKKTNWQTGNMSEAKSKEFVEEVYEKKGSYPMAQMSSHTIKQLQNTYAQAQTSGDVDTQTKIRAIAETFVSRYGSAGGGFDPTDADQLAQVNAGKQGGRAQNVTTNTAGAAHVAERVNELARQTGVYQPRDPAPPSPPSFPNIPHQN